MSSVKHSTENFVLFEKYYGIVNNLNITVQYVGNISKYFNVMWNILSILIKYFIICLNYVKIHNITC